MPRDVFRCASALALALGLALASNVHAADGCGAAVSLLEGSTKDAHIVVKVMLPMHVNGRMSTTGAVMYGLTRCVDA